MSLSPDEEWVAENLFRAQRTKRFLGSVFSSCYQRISNRVKALTICLEHLIASYLGTEWSQVGKEIYIYNKYI